MALRKYLRVWKNKTGKDISAFQFVYHIFDRDVVVDMIRPIYAKVQTQTKKWKIIFLFVNGHLFCPGYFILILSRVLNKKKKMAYPTCRIELKRWKGCLRFNINILCIRKLRNINVSSYMCRMFFPCTIIALSDLLDSRLLSKIPLFTACLSNAITCSHFRRKSLNPSLDYESRWNEFGWIVNADCMTISQSQSQTFTIYIERWI